MKIAILAKSVECCDGFRFGRDGFRCGRDGFRYGQCGFRCRTVSPPPANRRPRYVFAAFG